MNILTIDFETYYDKDYSLSKITTEEYVRDPRFEVIGVAVQIDDGEPEWFSGTKEQVKFWLGKFKWSESFALAHNAMFDAAILSWVFKIHPKAWLDTLSMARPVHGLEVGGSLKALSEHYGLGEKGTEVLNAIGKKRTFFKKDELDAYGGYCCNDVRLTYDLFQKLKVSVPTKELKLIDLTIKMFSEPMIELDVPLLEEHLSEVLARKSELLANAESDREIIMSNEKFATALMALGVEPPKKISARTGKEAWAFSKTDEGFKALMDHPDEAVQNLVAARLGVKTTLEETRTQRFIDIGKRGNLPVPLKYYAAHTGRWGGSDKVNLQNLPARDGKSKIKKALMAPKGYTLIDSDSSQIEARVLAWLSMQEDLVENFARGEDVYKIMASKIYGIPVDEVTKEQRFFGKTVILGCFGADTKVLTDSGWRCIVDVQATDMLWDGEEWVTHQGVVQQGVKETITAYGVSATPDHEILTEHGWVEWKEVTTNPSLFQSALKVANSQSLGGNHTKTKPEDPLAGTLLSNVVVGGKDWSTDTTSKKSELLDAIPAPKFLAQKLENIIGGMRQFFQTKHTGLGYSTEYRLALADVTTLRLVDTKTTGEEGYLFTRLGEKTEKNFLNIYSPLKVGMTLLKKLTGWTSTRDTNQTISDLQLENKTFKTAGRSETCKKRLMTYDIAYAGPKNRYTIATDAGVVIVHNCGYGMGAPKFQMMLRLQGVVIDERESERIIRIYRSTYPRIHALWNQGKDVLDGLLFDRPARFGRPGVVEVSGDGIRLPSGLSVVYPHLDRKTDGVMGGVEKHTFSYKARKETIYIYGGKVVENVVQALARCIVAEQMLKIAKKYRVVLTVHDAIMCVVKDAEVEEAAKYIEECMKWTPDWAAGLPVNCELGWGKTYADC